MGKSRVVIGSMTNREAIQKRIAERYDEWVIDNTIFGVISKYDEFTQEERDAFIKYAEAVQELSSLFIKGGL